MLRAGKKNVRKDGGSGYRIEVEGEGEGAGSRQRQVARGWGSPTLGATLTV